jgi:hypothetical protein
MRVREEERVRKFTAEMNGQLPVLPTTRAGKALNLAALFATAAIFWTIIAGLVFEIVMSTLQFIIGRSTRGLARPASGLMPRFHRRVSIAIRPNSPGSHVMIGLVAA